MDRRTTGHPDLKIGYLSHQKEDALPYRAAHLLARMNLEDSHEDIKIHARCASGFPASFLSRSLPHALDLPCHGRWRRYWVSLPGGREILQRCILDRDHQYPDRPWLDPDDIPPVRQGPLRAAWRCLPQLEDPGALPGTELDRGSGPDVPAGDPVPARLSRVHGGIDPDRPGALHCHGHCLE